MASVLASDTPSHWTQTIVSDLRDETLYCCKIQTGKLLVPLGDLLLRKLVTSRP